MTAFTDAIHYIRNNEGRFPPTLHSKEDQNELGQSGVSDHVLKIMHEEAVKENLVKREDSEILVCFVDGFLLYSHAKVFNELDICLLVRAPYETLKARREARNGYVTIDGNISH